MRQNSLKVRKSYNLLQQIMWALNKSLKDQSSKSFSNFQLVNNGSKHQQKQSFYRYIKSSISLHKKNPDGFNNDIDVETQQCFSFFSQALANARNLRNLSMSGMDMHPLLMIELGQGLQKNSSLRELNLSGCRVNSFGLKYLFSSIGNHKNLQQLNLFNNPGFSEDVMNDMGEFIFKGRNSIRKIKLTHCNLCPNSLCLLFDYLNYSSSITNLDLSMNEFPLQVIISLANALQNYKGGRSLDQLNIAQNNICNEGFEALANKFKLNIRKINIKELNVRANKINQKGVCYLEEFLRIVNGLVKLDVSQNKIKVWHLFYLLLLFIIRNLNVNGLCCANFMKQTCRLTCLVSFQQSFLLTQSSQILQGTIYRLLGPFN